MQPTEELDLHLLREIAINPQASQRGLAKRLGVSLGRVNYCLRALSGRGWVKARNFQRSDNKWAYAYILTPSGAQEKLRLTLSFLQRKIAHYDRLQDEIAQLRREIDDAPRSP